MTQYEFDKLLEKYLQGNCSLEEELLMDEWARRQHEQQMNIFTEEEENQVNKRLWKRIRHSAAAYPIRLWSFKWTKWGIAASLLFILSLFYVQNGSILKKTAPLSAKVKWIEHSNSTQQTQILTLMDGTTIKLEPNSTLSYPKKFNRHQRNVYLQGTAFFEVKRDPSKPFIIHSGNLVTEVLGTSFYIKQNLNQGTVEVSVLTGKVSVYAEKANHQDERNGLILTPNQRVTYDVASQNIVPSIVENPVQLNTTSVKAPSLDFEAASLQSVLDVLSNVYGIEFVISTTQIKDCTITADLNGLSMFTQLELICKSIDASYEKRGTVVFINGEGC